MVVIRIARDIGLTILGTVILIALGVLYFLVTVWMIKLGASWAGYPDVSGEMVVLTAGIVTAASLLGPGLKR